MLIVNGDRYRMAVQPGGPRPGAPAAPASQYPHDQVVPGGGNRLTAGHGIVPGASWMDGWRQAALCSVATVM